jgi:DSF synthase
MSHTELDHVHNPRYFKQLDVDFDHENGILWLHMKPEGRGCFTSGLLKELKRYQQGLCKWDGCYLKNNELYPVKYEVLASGHEGVFNYGGDLEFFLRAISMKDSDSLLKYGVACIDVVYLNTVNYNLPITTTSLVCGDALGGGLEAALSSSIVVAERGVQMGFPEIMFGLFPGMGAYQLLTRRVSRSLAKEIITSGHVYTAEEFHAMGLVDEVVDKGEGKAAMNVYIKKHSRHQNSFIAMDKVVELDHTISYDDLYAVVEMWVETAMNLTGKELRIMERLARAQVQKKTKKKISTEKLRSNYAMQSVLK